jgi:hypothetical protein
MKAVTRTFERKERSKEGEEVRRRRRARGRERGEEIQAVASYAALSGRDHVLVRIPQRNGVQ